MNDKNLLFYKNIGLDPFKELAVKGGFSSYKDLELISSYIPKGADILELGAGYGRCLEYFISHGHKGKLTAIEYSEPLAEYLRNSFKGRVEILQEDIKKMNLSRTYDVALWMWSGIIDFAPEEQMASCKKIYSLLNPGGRLFIDIPKLGVQTIATHIDSQHLVLTTDYGEIHAYIPDEKDLEKIRDEVGFKRLIKLDYSTTTDKKRTVYMLEK